MLYLTRIPLFGILLLLTWGHYPLPGQSIAHKTGTVLRPGIIQKAHWALLQVPVTVTATRSERSAGGIHDFYSEGDYWWPNSEDPSGPYIQHDGQTNPDNFTAHRKAMVRFSQVVGALASAYKLTGEDRYAQHALLHLKAWFIDPATRMNPSLLYAQAIQGRVTGRGIGIIDMIQMIEVAQSVRIFEKSKVLPLQDLRQIKGWFEEYLTWVTTHPYGINEREAKNNHGTCWVMQVAAFARLTGNQALLEYCTERFKATLLPNQMAQDGSFPLELGRTKPYGYSLFNLDAMSTVCHILSNKKEDLWSYTLPDGRTLRKAIEFLYPYVADKSRWPHAEDVMYWNEWPVAHPFLLFGYARFGKEGWFTTWKKLDHFPETEEVIRNLPIRNPLIWIE
jgi:hypothetical protein